ncbi:MAG TPA: endonuclease III [Candidatus Nanoarchaeia archaeon]|nr:endonuclease III [Candidatus Nanoarchaeia archaeon]
MEKAKEVIALLKKNYPGVKYYLDFKNPLELLVAAILSAQVRDEVVNATTPNLFKKYKSAKDYAKADLNDLVKDIHNISFAGNKAKHIKEACKIIEERYNGKVPDSIEKLTELPGIGRKTANVIMINGFNKITGIPCDVHVIRVSFRLGWTKNTNPDKIEQDLMKIISKEEWKKLPWLVKAHGRAICKAPDPYCSTCFLDRLCPKNGVKGRL